MDLTALKTYIEADPVFAEHVASGWDAEIARLINERTVPVVGSVSRAKLIQWATATGQRRTIELHANDLASPLADIALTLRDILAGALDEVDFADPANIVLLDAWLGGTVADETVRASYRAQLLMMASTEQPIFGQPVHHLDIAKALRG